MLMFLCPNAQIWEFALEIFKKIDKFEITFKKGYMRNFVKIGKSISFRPKCPHLGILGGNLKNEN